MITCTTEDNMTCTNGHLAEVAKLSSSSYCNMCLEVHFQSLYSFHNNLTPTKKFQEPKMHQYLSNAPQGLSTVTD